MPVVVDNSELLRFTIPDNTPVSGGMTTIDLTTLMRRPTRYGVSGNWTYASMRPFPHGSTNTSTCVSGRISYSPIIIQSLWDLIGIAIELTTAASAATFTVQFALYSVGSNGLPFRLVQDWSVFGLLNLVTGGAGFPALSFSKRTAPVGEYYIASLFLGTTVTTSPILRAASGGHPSVGYTTPGITSSGYFQLGATAFPAVAIPANATGAVGPIIFFQSA